MAISISFEVFKCRLSYFKYFKHLAKDEGGGGVSVLADHLLATLWIVLGENRRRRRSRRICQPNVLCNLVRRIAHCRWHAPWDLLSWQYSCRVYWFAITTLMSPEMFDIHHQLGRRIILDIQQLLNEWLLITTNKAMIGGGRRVTWNIYSCAFCHQNKWPTLTWLLICSFIHLVNGLIGHLIRAIQIIIR